MTTPPSSTDVAHGEVGDPYLISHMTLRKLLGFLGVFMPVILVLGVVVLKAAFEIGPHEDDEVFQPSISHYYHTIMRNAFVAIVAAFGFFLFTYRGYPDKRWWKRDRIFTNAAGACALLVACFPTNNTGECVILFCYIHFIAATLFFIILAYISYFLFTLSDDPPSQRTHRKRDRNKVYRICGGVMVLCIVILAIYFLFDLKGWPHNTVFIFEAIALIAFGISWLTKGEAILGDK